MRINAESTIPANSFINDHDQFNDQDNDNDDCEVKQATELVDGPPYGWVIVFASFVSQMITMGFVNTYGVFQVWFLPPFNIFTCAKSLFFIYFVDFTETHVRLTLFLLHLMNM